MVDQACAKKTFIFPKINYYGKRKSNQPEVEMELKLKENGKYALSICGFIWNSRHTDCFVCGQCLDDMMEFDSLKSDPLFRKLHRLWKLYHLNDMSDGSRSQVDALIAEFGAVPEYEKACEYLKSINLLEDENNYTYGSGWQHWDIPKDDIDLIFSLFAQ